MVTLKSKADNSTRNVSKTSVVSNFFSKLFENSIIIILFLIVWEIVPRLGLIDSAFLPPFSAVVVAGYHITVDGTLWTHFQASFLRSILGFFIALILSIPLGLLIGWYPKARRLFNPILEVFRNTATLALLPVFILLLGIGEVSKISIVVYSCFFPVLLNTIVAVKNVDPLLIKSARSMNVPTYKLFYQVVIPASLPTIFTGIRMAGSYAILVLLAAEMVGAKAGLGYYITFAQYNFYIAEMYAGIIVISLLGILVNYVLLCVERYFSRWKQDVGE